MKKSYLVYKHTNKINGKVYIGQTSKTIEERSGHNGNNYTHSSLFYSAICKYGWENFFHEVLEDNLTSDEASEREKYYIKLYRSNEREYGYNLTSGGEKQKELSPISREKMSLAKKGKPLSKEHRENISKAITGDRNPNYGKKCSNETKQKISKANSKPIQCVETGIIYKNKQEAAEKIGLKSPRSIMSALKEPWRTAGCNRETGVRYHWIYAEIRE